MKKRDFEYLINRLKSTSSIFELKLKHSTALSEEQYKIFAQTLQMNSNIFQLIIDGPIGDIGARYIAQALVQNKSIMTLDLANNLIYDGGAQYLADAIKANQTLKYIHLVHNKISNDGAASLADALKTNTSITMLNVKDNKIGDSGIRAIAEMLQINHALDCIDLSQNPIQASGVFNSLNILKNSALSKKLLLVLSHLNMSSHQLEKAYDLAHNIPYLNLFISKKNEDLPIGPLIVFSLFTAGLLPAGILVAHGAKQFKKSLYKESEHHPLDTPTEIVIHSDKGSHTPSQ